MQSKIQLTQRTMNDIRLESRIKTKEMLIIHCCKKELLYTRMILGKNNKNISHSLIGSFYVGLLLHVQR